MLSKIYLKISIILILLAIPIFATATLEGKVIRISDGDTIVILNDSHKQFKVRLSQIDAPERGQPFSKKSKKSLSDMVFGKRVRVEQEGTDRYGRVLGTVYINGLNVNAEQIKRGLAWVFRRYAKDNNLFVLEQEARNDRRGLWNDPAAIPPWEYRDRQKSQRFIKDFAGE